jgi:hypothetical protein
MKIGFTGTRKGCTKQQLEVLRELLVNYKAEEFHHGDAIGADRNAHLVAESEGIKIITHLPRHLIAEAYIERNHDIVDETDILIATPRGYEEETRSGTWATVRYARKSKKPVVIIFPNGTVPTPKLAATPEGKAEIKENERLRREEGAA